LFTFPATPAEKDKSVEKAVETPGPLTFSALKPVEAKLPGPSTFRTKTLEETVQLATNELEGQVKEFHKQSAKISAVDRKLVENGTIISKLMDETLQNEAKQKEIEQNLVFVENQQNELSQLLRELEQQLDKVYDPLKQSTVDMERERVYEKGENLAVELSSLSVRVSSLVKEMNSSRINDESDFGIAIKILNNHLDSLLWADRSLSELESSLNMLEKKISTSHADMERLK
jgi:nuclear pore complex protein Nup62